MLDADLDFVHRHELVLKALGHPMRCNPFILHHTTLCPDPFRGHHAKQPLPGSRKPPPPVPEVNETVGESDLARIQDHERTLLAELRFTGTVLRPPSPRQLMAWAQGPQSSLPDDGDVKLRNRELLGMEKRINTVQVRYNRGGTHKTGSILIRMYAVLRGEPTPEAPGPLVCRSILWEYRRPHQ
jgi:hypothetical protein